jgi:hypothetical protein
MVKKSKDAKPSKRRTQVKNLSKSERNLTAAETKKVKGGLRDIVITRPVDVSTPK